MAASSSHDNANGTVIEITQGSAELELLLQSAATQCQLLLLDFSASWCGPCRMLAPVLIQLAQENRGKVVVAKMDCEKTPANQSLAASSSISAYPTLRLYRDRQVVATLRGANPAALRQAIAEQLALLGPSAGRRDAPGALATALATALGKIKAGCSYEEFVTATKALLVYAGNVVKHPDAKYRKIRLSNQAFQARLGSKPGGRECMEILGFRERTEAMEAVLVMDDTHPQLPSVISLLEQAVAHAPPPSPAPAASRSPGTAAGIVAPSTSAPTTSAEGEEASALADALAGTARVSVPSPSSGGAVARDGNNTAGGGSGIAAAAVQTGSGSQPSQVGQRRRVVTPAMLAQVLEKALRESGF